MKASPSPDGTTHRQHNLPAEVSTFVGREHELADLKRILVRTRLLTLTGVGSVGKTRLALRAATDAAPGFPDSVKKDLGKILRSSSMRASLPCMVSPPKHSGISS